MIHAMIALSLIGGLLGLMLAIANKFLLVEDDPRIEIVTDSLPGVNCGGCGYPGCNGLANALIEGEVTSVSKCVVANAIAKEKIVNYLTTTPGPDGKTLNVTK